jgi:hypothetical protein
MCTCGGILSSICEIISFQTCKGIYRINFGDYCEHICSFQMSFNAHVSSLCIQDDILHRNSPFSWKALILLHLRPKCHIIGIIVILRGQMCRNKEGGQYTCAKFGYFCQSDPLCLIDVR